VTFAEDRVEISRRDGSLSTTLEMLVSPEQDAGGHRVTVFTAAAGRARLRSPLMLNWCSQPKQQIALIGLFQSFVETEYLPDLECLLAAPHPRSPTDRPAWAAHMAVVEGELVGPGEFETDRARFLGRGRSLALPRALLERGPLSGTVGYVLDPVFSLRRRLRLPRGGTIRVTFWTALAESREEHCRLVISVVIPRPSAALRRSPGLGRKCICIISALMLKRLACFSVWPRMCATSSHPASGQRRLTTKSKRPDRSMVAGCLR